MAASARRSPRWAASTSAAVSRSEAAFISTCSSDSCARAGAHLLGDLVAVALAADDPALDPLDPGADRGLGRGGRGGGGARRRRAAPRRPASALAQRLAVALAEQALGAAGVARRRARRRCAPRPAPPRARPRRRRRSGPGRGPRRRRVRPASISPELLLELAAALGRARPPSPTSRVSGPSSARSASSRCCELGLAVGERRRRGPRSAAARRAAWSAFPRPGCARGRGRRSAPRRRGGAR